MDNLLVYFAAKRIASFADLVPVIQNDESREIIRKLSSSAEALSNKYPIGDMITFVNQEYEILIGRRINDVTERSDDMQPLFLPLMEFCIRYQKGIADSVFLHIAENRYYIYFNYYDK